MNATWRCTLAATALIALALGSRSAFGLFVSPINTATGIGLAGISLAVAIGQLVQGVAQPVVGVLADRYGAARVIALGLALFAVGNAATIVSGDALAFGTAVVFTAAAATAMSSIAVLLAEVGRRVPPARQALAIGIVGAGGSLGQMLLGPGTQAVIDAAGWQAALWSTAGLALLALPLALVFRRGAGVPAAAQAAAGGDGPDRSEALAAREDGTRHVARRERHPGVAGALRSRDFWLIGAGFAACGMHIAFLNLHMPGVIDGCGLPAGLSGVWLAVLGAANIAGALGIGMVLRRHAPAAALLVLHGLRGAAIAAFLLLPTTPLALLAFAVAMGLTYMAILPPTTMLVQRVFGPARFASIFGCIMLLHQAGCFVGVWLGGLAGEWNDPAAGYRAFWVVDVALSLLAAAAHLPFLLGRRRPLAARPGARPAPRSAGGVRPALAA